MAMNGKHLSRNHSALGRARKAQAAKGSLAMLMIVLLGARSMACDFKLPTDTDLPNPTGLIGQCRGENTKIVDNSIARIVDDAS